MMPDEVMLLKVSCYHKRADSLPFEADNQPADMLTISAMTTSFQRPLLFIPGKFM